MLNYKNLKTRRIIQGVKIRIKRKKRRRDKGGPSEPYKRSRQDVPRPPRPQHVILKNKLVLTTKK